MRQSQAFGQLTVVATALLAGVVIGATAIGRLNAESSQLSGERHGKAPGAYAIIDVSFVTSADINKHVVPKATRAAAVAGGHYIARTERIVALRGEPPRRFVIVAFESMDQAKLWYTSPAQSEVNDLAEESQRSRAFIVEALPHPD